MATRPAGGKLNRVVFSTDLSFVKLEVSNNDVTVPKDYTGIVFYSTYLVVGYVPTQHWARLPPAETLREVPCLRGFLH